ncbi:MAG TPA: MFS transporter [Gaiellaceae bacterium]|nr:MFS transporter [Gaiellaceae bacterium]
MAAGEGGLDWVVGHPWLRYIASYTATSNFCTSVLFAIFLLYAVRSLGLSSIALGATFAVGSAGSITGALLANRLQRRLGVGPTIVGTAVFGSFGGILYPLAPHSFPLPFLMLGQAIFGLGAVAYNITQVSLRQAITPERLQGRMNAAMRWIVWGTIPLGTLTGGLIATGTNLRTALWVGAVGQLFAAVPLLLSTVRKIGEMPAPVEAPTPAQAELEGGLVEGSPLPGPTAADA